MSHLYESFKELIEEFIGISKNYFYDSYTGLKKKRIAIASASTLSVILLVVLFVTIVPNGRLADLVTDGIVNTADGLLPESVADGIKKMFKKETYGLFELPKLEVGQTVPADTGDSIVVPKDYGNDETFGVWVWTNHSRPPKIGDIITTAGEETTEDKTATTEQKSNAEEVRTTSGKYSWGTKVELKSKAYRKAEYVQDVLLLKINDVVEAEGWKTYGIDVQSALVDIEELGKEIRSGMSAGTVALWERLEPVYKEFYSQVYACENNIDLSRVAGSEIHTQAVNLTAEFLAALQGE